MTTSSGPHQKNLARFGTGIKQGLREEEYGFTLERCGTYQQVSFEENTFDASIRTMGGIIDYSYVSVMFLCFIIFYYLSH